MEKNLASSTQVTNHVGTITIIGNLILSLAKVITGIFAKSSSLVSDGVHSASDVLSTAIVMVGTRLSNKKADRDHPFGHERFQSAALIVLAVLLLFTAVLLGYNGVSSIIQYAKGTLTYEKGAVLYLAMGFAILSILAKGWMYFYTEKAAKKIHSSALHADAIHHLTDSLSSFASLAGIIGLFIGEKWVVLDPVASIIIAVFILKVSYDIAKDGFDQMVDKSAPEDYVEALKATIKNFTKVKRLNSLKTRMFGDKYYVEIEIAVDGNLSVKQGHDIAQKLHDRIEREHPDIKHCMIHVNPYFEKEN